jgi:hypothetical protein
MAIEILGGSKRKELEDMGIVVGPFDAQKQIYRNCLVSQRAFVQLLKKKGRFLWKLKHVVPGNSNRP